MTYLDEELKITISTEKFEEVSSIDGKWFTWWDFDSRTYYVAYKKSGHTVYLHRFITDCPKGMQVHHKDGNGLNNTNGNLVNVRHVRSTIRRLWRKLENYLLEIQV